LLALAIAGLTWVTGSKAGAAELVSVKDAMADRVLGNANAPVTIEEFASLTCPHCAEFTEQTLPQLKKDYIDTGKVKLIFRDFPLENVALQAAKLTRCAPPDRYYALIDVLYGSQNKWAGASDPTKALTQIGVLAGISPTQFKACLDSKELETAILQESIDAKQKHNVNSTPTFIFNGGDEKIVGALPYEQFVKVIDGLAKKS
jgi:protein-disulfide isomerase